MLTKRTTALLWDVDGTLIDTTAIIVNALGQMFRDYLRKEIPAEQLRALIGIPLDEQVRAFGLPENFGTSSKAMEEGAIRNYERQRSMERPITEAIEALKEAKRRGIKTALVTSKNDIELEHTLPRLGISAYCDAIIGADQVAPKYKPDPWPAVLALQKLEVSNPAEAIFIGDSIHDMHCGRAAGVRIAAVLWGAATAEALREIQPDFLFEKPEELMAFIDEQIPVRNAL
jgi:pyrophosphatase PpaX